MTALQSSSETVLQVRNVSKEYRLYASPRQRLKSLITGRSQHRSHWALKDVSFELRRGQCIGVIGDNGAGKSSLLKLLAGTLQPSLGSIERVGRVTAILELGAGFHPDFSGRDNLYFGGSLIGIDREEMQRLEPEIVEFCELGEALDRPVKTYSSGMAVRLAFALVTAVQPDVLIIDEALAVGDQHFQKKCVDRIMAFRDAGCTILFCSHSPYHIRHLCDLALWLKGGQVEQFGETEPVLAAYDLHTRQRDGEQESYALPDEAVAVDSALSEAPAAVASVAGHKVAAADAGSACILAVDVRDLAEPKGDRPGVLQSNDLVVSIRVRGRGEERPNIGFMIEQSRGVGITSLATHEEGAIPVRLEDGSWQSVLTFPDLPLHSGDYVISAYLFDETGLVVYDEWFQFLHFHFSFPKPLPGLVRLPHRWE
ncbi:ABC transporter ATP-binding protein [Paracidovorax konjaci]|uniref:Lipopolysaccharide transport system ATP-binding protein n=1 Tax=Paracidovorax konjaci TaxID=32040 RepID=A0A1I1S9J7_9BURK|nr:ABC transporter ATP-binding protein [Paracidovorax konjaci]SFD43184.1 lipopolysaccharide transport system ATP-binding protein [Paracidovorax konjaci]